MHRIVCDVSTSKITQVALTPEEIAELASRPSPEPASAPTKEQLMEQLAALSAQIQALE
jgi:hypothetical protein